MARHEDFTVIDPTESWRKRLIDPTIPTFGPNNEELFYSFDKDFPNFGISLQGHIKGTRNVLTPIIRKVNQLCVILKYNGKNKTVYINFVMAEFFLKKNPRKTKIINKDGDPKNNHISNIFYAKQDEVKAESPRKKKIEPFYRKDRPITELEEEARQKLRYSDYQFFDENGEEQFYCFDEKNKNYSVSLFGRMRGPRGIMNPTKPDSCGLRITIPEHIYIHNIMIDAFMVKDDTKKMEVFFVDGDKTNNNIANIKLIYYGSIIKNLEVLVGMRKLILTEECKKRLKNPGLPVYDENDDVIFYDYIYDGEPSGYKVSMTGRILSPRGYILTNHPHPSKYIYINLFIGSLKINTKSHVIVGDTFLISTDPKHEHNHIDFDPGNNYVDNLEKVSHSENSKKKPASSKCNRPLVEVDDEGNILKKWNKIVDFMEEFDISPGRYSRLKRYIENFNPVFNMNIRYEKEDKKQDFDYQYQSYIFIKNAIPIMEIDSNGLLKYWPSINAAASSINRKEELYYKAHCIKKCVDGKKKSAFSSKWRKASESEISEYTARIPPFSEKYGNWTRLYLDSSMLISDFGYIVSSRGYITKGFESSEGYKHIKFMGKDFRVNRLMIMAFDSDNYSEDLVVDHINGEKGDNTLSNLRIISQRDNIIYSTGIPVIGYKDNSKEIVSFKCVADAARFCGRENGSNILRALELGTISYGYYWKKV